MDQSYIHKLNQSFTNALANYIQDNSEHNFRGYPFEISKIKNVIPEPDIRSIPDHKILSGKSIEIDFDGTAHIEEPKETYTNTRSIRFWSKPCTIRFNSDTAEFEVDPITNFTIIDMS